jgi:site-specific DNA-methyltransferase (adenine-specific)
MDACPCCPACQGTAVIRKGRTPSGVQKYQCLNADCPQPFFRAEYYTPPHTTRAAYMAAYRDRKRRDAQALLIPPHVVCRQIGTCTLYCGDWKDVYPLLPRPAAVVTDPPYDARYDVTKARRRASKWVQNFAGFDQAFDPTPWFPFREVVLLGADHYYHPHMQQGSWCCWHKTPRQDPGDFCPHEAIWLSWPGPLQYFPHLYRGGMRAGEENYSREPEKSHPAQKPKALMHYLVQQTTATPVVDPFMGSGTTGIACLRLGRPFIGIEIDEEHFEVACTRLQAEVEKLEFRLFA